MKLPLPLILFTLLASAAFSAGGETSFQLSAEAVGKLQLTYAKAEKRTLHQMLSAPGSVTLDETRVVDVVPRITGMIAADHQAIGAIVAEGDPLFTLESGDLAIAITGYVDAEQAMAFEQAALAREKALFERNLSSKETLQLRELDFQKAVAGHARALQPLKILQFDEDGIHAYLENVSGADYTTLKVLAPSAGEVIAKSIRRGAAVEPAETLYTIADLSQLWVDFHVPLRDAIHLKKGLGVVVRSSVNNEMQGDAKIEYIAPLADEPTRTILVRALLPNAAKDWRPGTPVTVTFPIGGEEPVLSLPASALVDYQGGKAAFIVEGEGSFRPALLEVGESDGTVIQILSGIEAGETVVSANAAPC